RKRVAVEVTLPPRTSRAFTVGWVEGASRPAVRGAVSGARGGNTIFNGKLRITAKRGAEGLRVLTARGPLLPGAGLSAILVADPYGPWGGHYEEPASLNLNRVLVLWKIVDNEVLAQGPLRATLWCRLAGRRSHLDLHVHLERGNSHVLVEARLLFLEEKARLKLRLPGCARADFQVPGGVITRNPQGEVPGGRWVRARDNNGRARFLFASDALYGFNLDRGALHPRPSPR
ncbi:MAG: hypothetical protein ACKOTE_10105, partial [Opitutaceae bacterium]